MLVRVVVKNFGSFGNAMEFNMLPSSRQAKKSHHKYSVKDFSFLKMSAIYGANGAGKSNLSKALSAIQEFVIDGELTSQITANKHKFTKEEENQEFVIEIIHNDVPYIYGFCIENKKILSEELYLSSLGKGDDTLILKRSISSGRNKLEFYKEFYKKEENKTLAKVIQDNLIKKDKSVLKILSEMDNDDFFSIRLFMDYFRYNFAVISPESRPTGLALRIESEEQFKDYVIDMMRSCGIGIEDIKTETISLLEMANVVDSDNVMTIKKFIQDFKEENKEGDIVRMIGPNSEEIILVYEDGQVVAKRLQFQHKSKGKKSEVFSLSQESDGTIRLLDYMPLFYDVFQNNMTYFVDEIERSIHPLLIKKLVKLFADSKETKGQLIFTTHETNLLDQNILRTDEIWFMEKDLQGSSTIYPLSDFKEHHSKNIQKGYLNGRYGAIPFLGNLEDLNWAQYAVAE